MKVTAMSKETNPLGQDELIRSGPLKAMLGGVTDMTLFRWQRDRCFPAPIKLGGGTKFWRVAEVQAWITAKAGASAAAAKQAAGSVAPVEAAAQPKETTARPGPAVGASRKAAAFAPAAAEG
jgi:predicted DNA-binding transcriptional regulator AlpA